MTSALDGIRVLDLSRVLAGPWATQLLGDYGADVVKVERPDRGDDTRAWGPPWLGDDPRGESAYYLSTNRNKRSLAIDLSSTAGRKLVAALARRADVVVHNFRPAAAVRLGVDYDALSADNDALVYCVISAFASDSSRADEPGYDAMMQAAGGFMSLTGAADADGGSPQKAGVAIADIMTGMYAATGILAALHARASGAGGQRLEVPLFDAQVAMLANQNMNYLVGGQVPGRLGTAHPNIVPYQAFATADGHLMLAVGSDRQFADVVRVLGLEADLGGPAFATNAQRVAQREQVAGVLAAVFRAHPTEHWRGRLAAASVPCSAVDRLDTVFASDYAAEHLLRTMPHASGVPLPVVANPVRFGRTPVSYRHAPPVLGADADAVLRDWLGYSAGDMRRLADAGAVPLTGRDLQ